LVTNGLACGRLRPLRNLVVDLSINVGLKRWINVKMGIGWFIGRNYCHNDVFANLEDVKWSQTKYDS
jgi:hypothetical protein